MAEETLSAGFESLVAVDRGCVVHQAAGIDFAPYSNEMDEPPPMISPMTDPSRLRLYLGANSVP